MPERPIYSPVPARAMGDPALSGADLRVLMAIASHDRFGSNGTGCYASHTRLASITSLHAKAVARSIGRLRDARYISVERNPMNGRLAVYRVIYSDEDAAVMRGDGRSGVRPTPPRPVKTGSDTVTDNGATGSNAVTGEAGAIGSSTVTENSPIGNSENRKAPPNQGDTPCNIFPEGKNRLREALALEGKATAAPPNVMADAERAARAALSGDIDAGEGVDRLRRVIGRLRSYGDTAGEQRATAMMDTVIADAPRRERRPQRGPLASPMEARAIREARERGEPCPAWVRPEVRGAA